MTEFNEAAVKVAVAVDEVGVRGRSRPRDVVRRAAAHCHLHGRLRGAAVASPGEPMCLD